MASWSGDSASCERRNPRSLCRALGGLRGLGTRQAQRVREPLPGLHERLQARRRRRHRRPAGIAHGDTDGRAVGIGRLGVALDEVGDGPRLPFEFAANQSCTAASFVERWPELNVYRIRLETNTLFG